MFKAQEDIEDNLELGVEEIKKIILIKYSF